MRDPQIRCAGFVLRGGDHLAADDDLERVRRITIERRVHLGDDGDRLTGFQFELCADGFAVDAERYEWSRGHERATGPNRVEPSVVRELAANLRVGTHGAGHL